MLIKQIIEVFDLLDDSRVNGQKVKDFLLSIRPDTEIEVKPLKGPKGVTDMIKIWIKGSEGKKSGGNAPTIGLLGRLGGIGARPEMTGFVSDGDGALCALTLAAKLLDMQNKGDFLKGDVFISTHIRPTIPCLSWALPLRWLRSTPRRSHPSSTPFSLSTPQRATAL